MANPKINTVNVGGVDFTIQAASGSSDAGFVDDTIEAALKKLIDSFTIDGTYTGRFKATNTPNKWFSYQIDLFDTVASGYIVNTIDPNESYNVRYRTQTDEQATIIKTLSSHVGMIIHSTTLDTEEKVIAIYGGTSWSKIEGRVLVGDGALDATHSYTAGNTGGEPEHKLTINEMPSHNHSTAGSYPYIGSGTTYGHVSGQAHVFASVGNGITSTGGSQAHNNMQPYKVVYIWERTA